MGDSKPQPGRELSEETRRAIAMDREDRIRDEARRDDAAMQAARAIEDAKKASFDAGFEVGVREADTADPPVPSDEALCRDCKLRTPTTYEPGFASGDICGTCFNEANTIADVLDEWVKCLDRWVTAARFAERFKRLDRESWEAVGILEVYWTDRDVDETAFGLNTDRILRYALAHLPRLNTHVLAQIEPEFSRVFETSLITGNQSTPNVTARELASLRDKTVSPARVIVREVRKFVSWVRDAYFNGAAAEEGAKGHTGVAAGETSSASQVLAQPNAANADRPPRHTVPTDSGGAKVAAAAPQAKIGDERPSMATRTRIERVRMISRVVRARVPAFPAADYCIAALEMAERELVEHGLTVPSTAAADLAHSLALAMDDIADDLRSAEEDIAAGKLVEACDCLCEVARVVPERLHAVHAFLAAFSEVDHRVVMPGTEEVLDRLSQRHQESLLLLRAIVRVSGVMDPADYETATTDVPSADRLKRGLADGAWAVRAISHSSAIAIAMAFSNVAKTLVARAVARAEDTSAHLGDLYLQGLADTREGRASSAGEGGRELDEREAVAREGEPGTPSSTPKTDDPWIRGIRNMLNRLRDTGSGVATQTLQAALSAGEIHGAERRRIRGKDTWFAHREALDTWGRRRAGGETLPDVA